MSKGVNAPAPTTAEVVGGVYNVTPPVLVDGQAAALQVDVNGKLITSGSGGSGNVNITGINGTPPGLTNPLPVELSDGTNPVGTAGNPLSVNVITGGGSNASVGATGVAAPASATEIGIVDGTGKLQNVSTTNPVPENQTQIASVAIATAAAGVQKVGIVGATGTALDGTPGILDENVKNWGGTAVTAPPASGVPAVGTEVAPVVKPIQRKNNAIVTTAAIGASSNFTSAWVDTHQTGDNFVALIWNITSATGLSSNSLIVQGSDDQVNITNISAFTPTSGNQGTGSSKVPQRYWRIQQNIGTGGANPVYISATASNMPQGIFPQVIKGTSLLGDGLLVLLNSGFPADNSNAGSLSNNNFGAAASVTVAQMVVTSNPSSGANWSALRTPIIFKTVQATVVGNTVLWTPTTGKKFRLMRFIIELTENVSQAAGGVNTISFQDNTTPMNIAFDSFVPTTAVTTTFGGYSSGWIDIGNGFLSAVANNSLNVNLSTALATGNVRVTCCGTEE